jgi:hypothetical protein
MTHLTGCMCAVAAHPTVLCCVVRCSVISRHVTPCYSESVQSKSMCEEYCCVTADREIDVRGR